MPSPTSGAPSVSSATTNHRQASVGNPVYYSRSATPASVTGAGLQRHRSIGLEGANQSAAVDDELGVPLGAAGGHPTGQHIHKPHAVHQVPMTSGDSSPVALRETMQGGGVNSTSHRPESTASTARRSNVGDGSVVAGITKGSNSSHRGGVAASSKHDTKGGGDAASSHSTTYTGFGGLFDGPPAPQYQQQQQSPPSSQVGGGVRPNAHYQQSHHPSESGGARSNSMLSKYQESTPASPPQARPDERRTRSPGYVDEDNLSHYSSLKVKVVEYLRRTLIPMHRKGKVTRYDMIALCSEVCKEFVEERGLDDATMEGMSTEKLPVEDEMLISSLLLNNMREKQRREAEKEQNSFSDALREAKQEDARNYQDKLFQENMDKIQAEREALEAARQEFMAQQAHMMEQAKLMNERQERVGAGGAPLPEFVPMRPSPSAAAGRSPTSGAGEFAVRPAGGPSSSLVPVPRPPTDSLFQSVTYTISGRIPNAHTHFNPRIGDQHLRVSLNSPPIQESDTDIVVSCSVSTRTPVTLTWWLAYGPRTLVLNLDKMYNDRLVTTYQISESSFILTFKQGSLVPGWDYTVCLGVTSVTGSVVSAKTSFKVPPEIGKRDPNEDRAKLKEYVGDRNHYIGYDLVGGGAGFEGPTSPGGNSVASPNPYTGRTQDMYYGDVDINEDEHFQQQRRWDLQLNNKSGGGGHHDDHHGQYDVYDGTGGQEQGYRGIVHGRALDNLGGYQHYVDQQIYRNQKGVGGGGEGDGAHVGGGGEGDDEDPELSGSGYDRSRRRSSRRGRAIRSTGSKTSTSDAQSAGPVVYPQGQRPGVRGDLNPFHQPAVGVQGATYQEQLRLFFTDQVQPLYYLSPNPSISEESFNTLVKNIARRYWYAYDRRQEVTDNLKREIIMCVKDEICRYALSTD